VPLMISSPASATVLVAHAYPVVSAGLVSTLRRLPDCEVLVWDDVQGRDDQTARTKGVQLVFGDFDFVSGLLADIGAGRTAGTPKVVMVTTHDDDLADPLRKVPEGVDSCLSVQCQAQELFDTVRRLSAGFAQIEVRSPSRGGLAPGALRRVREHIETRLADRFELRELSTIAGLSATHFCRAFKQSVGVPPHRYLNMRRISAAAELVRDTDRPLIEISLNVGFSDQSHFTRTFVRLRGETPSAFRHRHR
jgi:AraC-like DNA-binding protein